jgi:hypothetical protein
VATVPGAGRQRYQTVALAPDFEVPPIRPAGAVGRLGMTGGDEVLGGRDGCSKRGLSLRHKHFSGLCVIASDMKITRMPPCPETVKGRISEVPSCAHRDAMGKFLFGWDLSGISDSQTVKAMVRLGATAVDGTFETQVCRRIADSMSCGEKTSVSSFSAAGDLNGTSLLGGTTSVPWPENDDGEVLTGA